MKIYNKFNRVDKLEPRIELSLNENFKDSLTVCLEGKEDIENILYAVNELLHNDKESNETRYTVKLFFGEGYWRELQFPNLIATLWYIFTFKLQVYQKKVLDFIGSIYNWLLWKKFCLKHNISKDRCKHLKKTNREFIEDLIKWENK